MRGLSLGVLLALSCSPSTSTDTPDTRRQASNWTWLRSIPLSGAESAHFDPTGTVMIAASDRGLVTIPVGGGPVALAEVRGVTAVVVASDGTAFASLDGPGIIVRTVPPAEQILWTPEFTEADNDPVGMAIAPASYTGPLIEAGEGIVVDRGAGGDDALWAFSTVERDQPARLVLPDNEILRDAVDIAVSDSEIMLVDTRESSAGRLYRITNAGQLAQRLTPSPIADPTGIDWDPTAECWLVAEAESGEVLSFDSANGPVTTEFELGGSYDSRHRANLDVSDDGFLLAVTVDGEIQLYGRCSTEDRALDCDNNGTADTCDMAMNPGSDCDGDGILDDCVVLDPTNDCDDDGLLDACPVCLDMDVAILLPADLTLAETVCDALPGIQSTLDARGLDAGISIWSVGDSEASCSTSIRATFGSNLPAGADPALGTLAACSPSDVNRDWGRGTATLANRLWSVGLVRRRVVVPIIDGPPVCGASSTLTQSALDLVISASITVNAAVHPVVFASASTQASAAQVALGTGGQAEVATNSTRVVQGILAAITARCRLNDDCDADALLDRCQPAAPGTPDCDCDSFYDGCTPTGGQRCTDIDDDGLGPVCDICEDPDDDGYGNAGTDRTSCSTGDGIDNCPEVANNSQEDLDNDGLGNACDTCDDADADGWGDEAGTRDGCLGPAIDNCPDLVNVDQVDSDNDGLGDACDPCIDNDNDGVSIGANCMVDAVDNCPNIPNLDQIDTDDDGLGDACDVCDDRDGDGVGDLAQDGCEVLTADNCPTVRNTDQADADGDGTGDACDACEDADMDGFGVGDGCPNPGADCNDQDRASFPGATELAYDGVDQDCDGADLCDVDADGALAVVCGGGDCDDSDPTIGPGMADPGGDGVDQDCDPTNELDGCACQNSTAPPLWSWLMLFAIGCFGRGVSTRRESC
ncbi:MAG: hypothetical protein ACI855_000844 [Myxococcota bacterium]|jgi:hypothetical protein